MACVHETSSLTPMFCGENPRDAILTPSSPFVRSLAKNRLLDLVNDFQEKYEYSPVDAGSFMAASYSSLDRFFISA